MQRPALRVPAAPGVRHGSLVMSAQRRDRNQFLDCGVQFSNRSGNLRFGCCSIQHVLRLSAGTVDRSELRPKAPVFACDRICCFTIIAVARLDVFVISVCYGGKQIRERLFLCVGKRWFGFGAAPNMDKNYICPQIIFVLTGNNIIICSVRYIWKCFA